MNAYDVLKIVSAALASLGGGGLIVMAMFGWLGRVWADRLMEKERNEHARILEQDRSKYAQELERERAKYAQELEGLKSGFEATHRRLQAELDKTVFGHQLFVQTEFEAMKAVVPCLQKVQSAIYMVRAVHKNIPAPRRRHLSSTRDSNEAWMAWVSHWKNCADRSSYTVHSSQRRSTLPYRSIPCSVAWSLFKPGLLRVLRPLS